MRRESDWAVWGWVERRGGVGRLDQHERGCVWTVKRVREQCGGFNACQDSSVSPEQDWRAQPTGALQSTMAHASQSMLEVMRKDRGGLC